MKGARAILSPRRCNPLVTASRRVVSPQVAATVTAIAAAAVVLGIALPTYRAQSWTLWPVYGLLALSFTFVWGRAGIFSFGQAAFFGVGAYAYGVAGIDITAHTGESLSGLAIAALVGAAFAGVLGYFIFYGNVGDVYVAIITLAVSLVLLTFMSSTAGPNYHIGSALLGGYNGMVGVPPVTFPGAHSLGANGLFTFAVLVAGACALWLRWLLRRPFGRVIESIRENEYRTQLLGYDVRRFKLVAFVIGGTLAGLAGGLYSAWGMYINPDVFGLQQAALVVIWVLVGGRRSIAGAFVGVILLQSLTTTLGKSGGTYTPIVLGGILIAVVLFLPDGILPNAVALARRTVPLRRSPEAPPLAIDPRAQEEQTAKGGALVGEALQKRFGGLQALRDINLEVPSNEIRCLIGPNGAGKSTFFNLLVGKFDPSAGRVRLNDVDITGLRPDQRARLGIGIKTQVPNFFGGLTTLENVWLAAYRSLHDIDAANAAAWATLSEFGLADKAGELAERLSHGEHQRLEIGMVSVARPAVVLLDEPTAGMTRQETGETVELIRRMSRRATVVVVEHDMEFVRTLNAPVTMFHEGAVFASGSIEELRRNEQVLDIYLGRATADASS